MAKKSKSKLPISNQKDSQKSKIERTTELIQAQKQKIDAALATDERVAAKIEEYEQLKSTLEEDYKRKEESLDSREAELKEKASENEKKELELLDLEKQTKKACEEAVAAEITRIKDDEKNIREKEKVALFAKWEEEKSTKEAELEAYIAEQKNKIDDEYSNAHKERMEAEECKFAKIREADSEIEQKKTELLEECAEKLAEYSRKKLEYEKKLGELSEQKADLDSDTEYVQELKVKYNKYSESEVLRLQQEKNHLEAQIQVFSQTIQELNDKIARMSVSILDDKGQSLVIRNEELRNELEDARQRLTELANMPSEEEIERLRDRSKELEEIRDALDDEKQKRREAEAKVGAYAMSARELENARVSAAALESLNNQLQMKLKYISEQYKTTQESKFRVLLDIDKEVDSQKPFVAKGFNGDLDELCEYVRDYGAKKKGLYYSIETIRVFFASLAASERASRLIILQGLSGTGKSSLPRLVAEALGADCKLVPVQPSWRDNRELLGYDNDFTNRFKETEFTKYLYEASAIPNRNKIHLIVLDEMNLARIEYYFADFLSVLEKPNPEEWKIPLVSGYKEFDEDQKPKYLDSSNEAANICVTRNIWFVGTANNDDSTSLITDKVYDRAQVLDMDSRENEFEGASVTQISMDVDDLLQFFDDAKAEGKNRLNDADRENINMVDEYLKEMDITFGNRIKGQMEDFVPVYVACGGTKEEAIDYLITHKILRKLDERYEPYLVTRLDDLEQGLNEIYGDGTFEQSLKKIKKLRDKIQGK